MDFVPDHLRREDQQTQYPIELSGESSRLPRHDLVPVVAIPDLHSCNPKALAVDLKRYRVTDRAGRLSPHFNGVACALGDYVDRGAFGVRPFRLLKRLQSQDPDRVKLLFGNHDLFHLAGCPEELRCKPYPGLSREYRDDILAGRVQMAWAERDVLYSHAGICLRSFPRFVGESPTAIADALNVELRVLASKIDLTQPRLNLDLIDSNPLFGSRGPLWARHDVSNQAFRQVVGHTPQFEGIKDDPQLRVKYVDAARVFLEDSLDPIERERGRTFGRNTVLHQSEPPEPLRKKR